MLLWALISRSSLWCVSLSGLIAYRSYIQNSSINLDSLFFRWFSHLNFILYWKVPTFLSSVTLLPVNNFLNAVSSVRALYSWLRSYFHLCLSFYQQLYFFLIPYMSFFTRRGRQKNRQCLYILNISSQIYFNLLSKPFHFHCNWCKNSKKTLPHGNELNKSASFLRSR
jgi:hypothetical protein